MNPADRLKARPARIRLRLSDDGAQGGIPLELPRRKMWPVGLILAGAFAIFAAVEWTVIRQISAHAVKDVFDLMIVLFYGFWVLGWSVGVVILGALAVLLCFYGESARLEAGKLVVIPRLGPLKVLVDYDLARMRNLRIEPVGSAETVRVRFDYGEGVGTLGDTMPRAMAEQLLRTIGGAGAPILSDEDAAPPPAWQSALAGAPTTAAEPPSVEAPPFSIASPSGLALIVANLLPLAGVVLFGWDLASIMVLFWAESGIIAFYTALKMAVVGKYAAILAVPFFLGHFGGFMAGHFLFIYTLFVRGADSGPLPGVGESLHEVFVPIWASLAALFISHGVSFFTNFIGRREYAGASMNALMTGPYNRIIAMHLALIFGGWVVLLLKDPVPALVVLVLLKTAFDLSAHRKERKRFAKEGADLKVRPT